jgi:hypothetical protein
MDARRGRAWDHFTIEGTPFIVGVSIFRKGDT